MISLPRNEEIWSHRETNQHNEHPKPSCSLVMEVMGLTLHATLMTGIGVILGNGHEGK